MSSFAALQIVVVVGGIVWAIVGIVRMRREYDRTRREIAKLIGATSLSERGTVTGTLHGRPVRLDLASRGSGSNSVSWTEVYAIISPDVTTRLALRPQTLVEEALKKVADTVDVIVGDPAFDRAFIVEGAPAAAVRSMFADAALRARLLALSPVELTQTETEICLAKKGWLKPEGIVPMLASVVDLADRLEQPVPQSPYRSAEAHDASAELAALVSARAQRAMWKNISFGAAVLVIPALFFGPILTNHC